MAAKGKNRETDGFLYAGRKERECCGRVFERILRKRIRRGASVRSLKAPHEPDPPPTNYSQGGHSRGASDR